MKRFMLMQQVNPEGLYGTIQACMPHWKESGWYVACLHLLFLSVDTVADGGAGTLVSLSFLHRYTRASSEARHHTPWARSGCQS